MSTLAGITTAQAGAQSAWDETIHPFVWALDRYGPWALALVVLVLVVRALSRQRRYRALHALDEAARARVHAAIVAAERRTCGEVVPVVLERSDRHPEAEWLSALTFMLLGSGLLENVLPWHAPHLLLAAQLALGFVGFLLARVLPGWKRTFVSEARATEMATEQAIQEFDRLRLRETAGKTGVLIFVSLLEQRVIVLADEGIHGLAGTEAWERTREPILAAARRGDLAHGLVEGIRQAGEVLSTHAPHTNGHRNEVPDRLIVRAE